ncbi:MFS general substrate transporter [Mycena sanguinolenta]|uniref:MFS general substrate transporter n=1 Tax=Mycena sanguinolenta TaxID=230812 RepID=A0A8H7DIQ5_9AGAR|nr:MFS general substrate transporter [Mycena sanguinolenta]
MSTKSSGSSLARVSSHTRKLPLLKTEHKRAHSIVVILPWKPIILPLEPGTEAPHPTPLMGTSIYSVDKDPEVIIDDTEKLAIEIVDATGKYTHEDFDRVLRKQDMILMPLMVGGYFLLQIFATHPAVKWLAYGIQQVDKTVLATQATFGIIADTHMKGNEYAWLSTIFFIFYLLGEFPGNWIMQRFSVGKTLALAMFCWGTAAQNWRDLMIMRALQGFAESVPGPALLLITGMSYRTEEHFNRILVWGSAGLTFTLIISLSNYGIGRAAQAHPGGLAAWRRMSLFLGSISIFASVLCFFCLGTPREVFWLSPEERKIQAARVARNNTGSDAKKRPEWKWSQVSEAFMDPQLYFFFFVTVSNAIPTGGVNTFGNLIYVGLGFSPLDTILEGTIPQDVLGIFWLILAGYILTKFKNMRFYWVMLSTIPACIGMLVLSLVPTTHKNLWPKWGAYLITVTFPICSALVWSTLSTNVAGRTKKSVISVVLFVAYSFGNAVGAQVFQAKWAPRYRPSTVILSVMLALEFVLMAAWRIYYVTINRRRAAKLDARGVSLEERTRLGSLMGETDITDLQNEYFVYNY